MQHGQTLWSIARAYKVGVQALARANRLSDVDVLRVGQRVFIPGASQRQTVSSRCPCGTASPVSVAGQTALPAASRPALPVSSSETSALQPHGYIWPVQGPVRQEFRRAGKQRHDGIDIAAPEGTPILAAADGEVIFSDWGPGGYGRIVILRHKADIITVYAHNQRNLVRAGQYVRQGEPVATVGNSGRASGYHVHFEIRRKTIPVSPFQFLPRSRHLAQLERR